MKSERKTPFVDIPVHIETRTKLKKVKKLKNTKSYDELIDKMIEDSMGFKF